MSAGDELAGLLGPDVVDLGEEAIAEHAHDWSAIALVDRRSGIEAERPSCVATPRSEPQVAELLRWADRTRTPVVPFGGGSSVVRGIEPRGAVVLDTKGLAGIGEIDTKSRLVTVGAGVTGPALAEALGAGGFRLGHEPQSVGISTVGGWLATRACGQLSARVGAIEDLVAGLRAVLPGGLVVVLPNVPRASIGPDLKHVFLGSEGTLGVITEATLRIEPVPQERADLCLRVEHMADGVAACRSLAQGPLRPTVVRLYDAEDSMLLTRHLDRPPSGPILLLSFEGDGADERAASAADSIGGQKLDDDLVAHWWAHRNDAVDDYRSTMSGGGLLGEHALIDTMEVASTWSGLRDLYHSMKEALTAEAHLVGCHISHVYPDGACLYFTLASACESDDAARELHARWWGVGMNTCLAAGAAMSHHHGVGRLRAPWMERALNGGWGVLRAVKSALDPNRIMNPGALGL